LLVDLGQYLVVADQPGPEHRRAEGGLVDVAGHEGLPELRESIA
jgi:hypothetical protein